MTCAPGGWSSRELLALALALAWLCGSPSPLPAQTASGQSGSPPEPPSLMQRIENLQTKSTLLVERLTERTQQVADLESRLRQAKQNSDDSAASSETLAAQLQEARTQRDSLQSELTETLNSLDKLRQTLLASEKAFADYQTEMRAQVRDLGRERDIWRAVGIGGVVATVIAVIVAAVK